MDDFFDMLGIPDGEMSNAMKQAKEYFLRIHKVSEAKDVEKTSYCFYDIIKNTYALAEKEGVLEKDREDIVATLKGMQMFVTLMFMQHGWDNEMVDQFNNKIDELWIRE